MKSILLEGVSIFSNEFGLDIHQQRLTLDAYFREVPGFAENFKDQLDEALEEPRFDWAELAARAGLFKGSELCESFLIKERIKYSIHYYIAPESYYSEAKICQYLSEVVVEMYDLCPQEWIDAFEVLKIMKRKPQWIDAQYFYANLLWRFEKENLQFRWPNRYPCDAGQYKVNEKVFSL